MTDHKHKHNESKKRRRWPWYLLLGILVVLTTLRFSLRSDFVREVVKNRIISAANEQLEVTLSIEELKGDLWREVILHDVSVTDSDTLAGIDSVRVSYKLLSYFQSVFEVSEITVSEPFLKLRQQNSELNITTWLKPSSQDTAGSEAFPIRVDKFQVHNGKIDAVIEVLDSDSAFVIDNLELNSNFALLDEEYEANIFDLSFDILQTRLDEAISFESSFRAEKQTISLEKLVLATGNSVLQSSGNFDAGDSTANLNFKALPLAWRDIAAYVDQSPVQQNLAMDLSVKGNINHFRLGLAIQADDIENLELGAGLRWDSTLTLTTAEASATTLNLSGFFGDTSMPEIADLQVEAKGNVPLQNYENSTLEGSLTTSHIRQGSYRIDTLNSAFSLAGSKLITSLETNRQQQRIQAELNIDNFWGAQPAVTLTAEGRDVNPGYWLKDEDYAGELTFSGKVTGTGLMPGESNWDYHLDFNRGSISQQSFNKITLQGIFNKNTLTNETLLRLKETEVTLNARLENYSDIPQFSYDINSKNFDLSEFRNMEAFASAISFSISGEGRGASLETLQMQSEIRVDSSTVSGERIEGLTANIAVKDTVATVDSAELQSSIAEGSFDARFHLNRWYDTDNELNLDLEMKDLRTMAPLAGIEELQAVGLVKGNLAPISDENLKFTGEVDLNNLVYNEQFNAENAFGTIEVLVMEEPEFAVDLELVSPTFSTVQLQDLLIQTRGNVSEAGVEGTFDLNFFGPNESEILHSGHYRLVADSSVVITEKYDMKSSLHTLVLEHPFRVIVKNQSVRMDTMRLSSDDGTSLELAVPYADSIRQEGYLIGENLNLSVIQSTLLSESYIDGMLSGNLSINNSIASLEASGRLLFSKLNYRGTSVDSLELDLDIGSNQLKGNLSVIDQDKQIVAAELNLPFQLGNPLQFGERFFERPVDGSFRLERVALSRYDTLLARMGLMETEGMLQITADLEGTAGDPQFRGNMTLDSALISGVKIDSLTASLEYIHESSNLSFKATVNSLKQRAAEIQAEVPFYVDLRRGDVSLPGKEDSISVDIQTNNFNLAAFNDFVDREQVHNIKGRVNGMVHVMGTLNDLNTKGELNFTETSLRVVKAGITVDGIKANLGFEPELVTVKDFSARSGSGTMNMNGNIALNELIPGDVNITLKAKNFSVANTLQYNAAINLDTKMTGSLTQPNISGSLSVLNGFVQLENFGEKSVESVELDASEKPDNSMAMYDSLALDMDVSFNRRFFLRNQRYLDMEVELDGSVDMVKNAGEDLQMFGALETAGGYARPLGKRFELEEGVVTFSGDATNPDLNIRTLFEPQQPEEDIMIWYIIGGDVEDPTFKYESSPPMELEDILCYTLFSQPCYALESWKRAVASTGSSSGATGLALEVLSDRIESLATQSLGIDVVRIDNTRVGGDTGTSITTGWYINPKTFFAIQNVITGSTPDTSFLLEYMLMENLKLIISQGNESGQGLDLRWNYDY